MKRGGLILAGIWLVIVGLTLSVLGYNTTVQPSNSKTVSITSQHTAGGIGMQRNGQNAQTAGLGVFLLPAGASISVGGLLLMLSAWGRDDESE
ncbi:hypothetical protein [Desulfosudis oleivorans]|uniref:Uncharacterized protein n=1 Tax=Desulfosudis oleivorans (strain DSM 6200 / JCM 39069 / Hxd3) TaxID=96561 RepID=A9A0J5_DESOH|nr:hypothetical protein [Desulfosudis oleivorans]ABW67495.1 hypothetical protein Dole_1691 [Desulfosudis oleivorans Hxd3]